jgi:hypothetical protein
MHSDRRKQWNYSGWTHIAFFLPWCWGRVRAKTNDWVQVGHLRLSGSSESASNNISKQLLRMVCRWSCFAISLRISKMRSKCSCERRHVLFCYGSGAMTSGGWIAGRAFSWCSSEGISYSILQVSISKVDSKSRVGCPGVLGGAWKLGIV